MTISLQQNWTNATGSTQSLGIAFANNPTAGDLVVCFAQIYIGGASLTPSVSDDFGDTVGGAWQTHGPLNDPLNNFKAVCFYRTVGTGASNKTVTVSISGGVNKRICLHLAEYKSSVSGTFAVDGTPVSGSATSTNPTPSSAITTTTDTSVVLGYAIANGGSLTAGSGYTSVSSTAVTVWDRVEHQITTSAGNYTPNWTANNGDWAALGIAFQVVAPTSIALTGTVTTAKEADIVAGGKTIILTVSNDTWVADDGTFAGQRQNIIDGIDSAQSEATGWDAEVKAKQGVAGVVRTSNTVATITLDAQAAYDITALETITATIPATALVGNAQVVASPTFNITTDLSMAVIAHHYKMMRAA